MKKRKHRRRPAAVPTLVSIRLPEGEPGPTEFVDQTYAWLDEMKADFLRSTGAPFEGGNGVLFALDVLIELHGHGADWSLFDVAVFERWIEEHAPGFAILLPTFVSELACFMNYLARNGRIAPARALEAQERMLQLLGDAGAAAMAEARRHAAANRFIEN